MKRISITSVGGSSILTIFAVLCLIVFALLSLSTAKGNRNLTDKSIQATKNYYEADAKAEKILGEIRSGKVPEGVTVKDKEYSYQCRIDDNQELQVCVKVDGEKYQIKKWKSVYTGEWQADETIQTFGTTEIED